MTYHGGLATHKILILAPVAYNLSPTTAPVFSLPDHALVTLEGPDAVAFAHAQFADTLDLAPGDTVLAMGAPWGLSNSMSAGVVNNPRRLLVSLFDDEADYEDRLGAEDPAERRVRRGGDAAEKLEDFLQDRRAFLAFTRNMLGN